MSWSLLGVEGLTVPSFNSFFFPTTNDILDLSVQGYW